MQAPSSTSTWCQARSLAAQVMSYAQVKHAVSLTTYLHHAKTPYAATCTASCHVICHTMVRSVRTAHLWHMATACMASACQRHAVGYSHTC